MIHFKTLTYKNFLSVGNSPIEINLDTKKATLICGKNGSGKSSVIDALFFALFGKPHRKINKGQLINSINEKGLLVTVEFLTNRRNKYRIIRGLRPNIFEIYHNDKLVNQESRVHDYQKWLEVNVLKFNPRTFRQVVVLGSGNFIPFMQLPTWHRREVIEDLLDIHVFGKMFHLLKERYAKLRDKIAETTSEIARLNDKEKYETAHLRRLSEIILTHEKGNKKELRELAAKLAAAKKTLKDTTQRFEKKKKLIVDRDKISELISTLNSDKRIHSTALAALKKKHEFFDKNNSCPSCGQKITAKNRSEHLKEILTEQKKLTSELENINKKLEKLTNQFNSLIEEIRLLGEPNIERDKTVVTNIEDSISQTENKTVAVDKSEIDAIKKEIADCKANLQKCANDLKQQKIMRQYFDEISEMLKDTGIKSKIIKQYLPVMNKQINRYLEILDFFVLFVLDEGFNETIKSRHRDDFCYSSFSEGEKQRIDLAMLFAWRSIARMKNSLSTNILILDEIGDSSLDTDGIANMNKIFEELKGSSPIIISHREEAVDSLAENRMVFVKNGHFSQIQ